MNSCKRLIISPNIRNIFLFPGVTFYQSLNRHGKKMNDQFHRKCNAMEF